MGPSRVERRLAAIMATDIVGYSRLIEADEADTLAAIKRLRSHVMDPLLAEYKGRVVKLMGDGALVEFGSVVDAVACAVALQRGVANDQEKVSPERRILLRIGINLGDVVVEGDDLFGDGVNVAARLQSMAEPGGICIAETVHWHLSGKGSLAFDDCGECALKNISRPVRVWRWSKAPAHGVAGASISLPDKPSIAILPFDNLSGPAEETYFSDGITEDIITGLSRFRSLLVIASHSSFAFRAKPIDVAEVGRKLGVSYLLEGTVRRVGNRVRITVQLIEAASGVHLWAERYDRDLDDIFAVQDELTQTIVSTLVGSIENAKLQQSFRKPTASLAAYDFLLRGIEHFRGYAADDNQQACRMFERAVALDPRSAPAHAYLALAQVALHGYFTAPAEVLEAGFARATHALALDPQESRCHAILAVMCLYLRHYDTAEDHCRRAVDLNPNHAYGVANTGLVLARRGRSEEALGWIRAAMRLNPFSPSWYNVACAEALYLLRRYAEAVQALKRLPDLGLYEQAWMAACYAQAGQPAEAQAQTGAILRRQPNFSTADFLRGTVLLERAGDRDLLREGLIGAGLPE
jgi:TolB-like protein/class 3 adenylate cyclase/Tfp pilus assembly protein PilF